MKKVLIPVIAAITLGASGLALAGTTSIGIGYDNVGIHLGNGISASVPSGKLTVGHTFGITTYGVGFDMVDGAGNGLTYQHLQVSADKLLPFDGGKLSPEIMIGGSRVGVAGGNVYHVSTAYAGFGASYSYPIGRYVSLDGSAAIGRDFATHVTGLHTVGGLFYQAGAEVDFSGVGPGLFSVDYEYRHLPISCIPQYPHEHQWLSGAVQHHFLVLCHIPQDAAPARGTSRWRKVLVFGALIHANPFVAWFSEDLPSAEIFSSIKRPQTLYWVRLSVKPPTPFANG